MASFLCLEQWNCLLDFFIRFRSDGWPGQRDGRRLFHHAAPGCFPDLKGVLWLGFCAWNSGIACQNLDCFIRFRTDVWPGQRDGRRLFRHAVPGCFPDSNGVLWLRFCSWNSGIACQNLDLFLRFRSDVWPGQRDGRRLFRHAVPGCFPDSKGVLWLGFCAGKIDFFIRFRSDVWLGQRNGRRLFRHAVPGCLPDLKGVLWLGFWLEQWNCLPEP